VLLAPAPASLVVPASLAVGIPAEVLRQRPDVIAAERRLAAETARIGVAEAALYPSLNLSGSLGLSATSPGRLVSDGTSSDSSNFGINLPLFNGGRLRQALALQSAVQEQALLNYEKTLLAALEDVENALFGMVSNRARIEALTAAADAANAAALLARQRYTSGLVDFAVVLTTERSQRSVEDSLVSARNDEILAVISLYKALGGGWPATTVTPPASDPQVTL
jgi:outer membrane protein, multidrug efflux system